MRESCVVHLRGFLFTAELANRRGASGKSHAKRAAHVPHEIAPSAAVSGDVRPKYFWGKLKPFVN